MNCSAVYLAQFIIRSNIDWAKWHRRRVREWERERGRERGIDPELKTFIENFYFGISAFKFRLPCVVRKCVFLPSDFEYSNKVCLFVFFFIRIKIFAIWLLFASIGRFFFSSFFLPIWIGNLLISFKYAIYAGNSGFHIGKSRWTFYRSTRTHSEHTRLYWMN